MRFGSLDFRKAGSMGLLAAIFFLMPSLVTAQNVGDVQVHVLGDDGRTLSGILVEAPSVERRAFTDARGYAVLRDLPTGDQEITVSSIGFGTRSLRAEVSGGGMVHVEVALESSAIALEGLIVTGQVGQAEAYSRQRAAASLRNIVSSDHIERFPDSQVPDVLRRIPGISAQPDRGETGFVFIRGLSPDFTTVTIDGTRVPSTDRTGRGTELSSIPAEMLESVEVIKAITPDMDADAVGGSINLTARQPTRSFLDGRVEGGTHSLAGNQTWRGGLNYGEVWGPVSLAIGGDYSSQYRQTENLQFYWTDFEGASVPERLRIQQYPIERTRYSFNSTLNYALTDDSRVFLRAIYSRYDTREERHRVTYRHGDLTSVTSSTGGRTERQAREYLWERTIWDLTAGGDHALGDGGVRLDYAASLSQGNRIEPYRNYFEFRQSGVDFNMEAPDRLRPSVQITNAMDPNDLSTMQTRYYEQRFDDSRDRDLSAQASLTIPLSESLDRSTFLKFGGKVARKDKERDYDRIRYDEIDGDFFMSDIGGRQANREVSPDNYDLGTILDWERGRDFWNQNLDRFADDLNNTAELSETEDYSTYETVASAFIMGTADVGDLQIVGGVRYEHTSGEFTGKRLSFGADGEFESVEEVDQETSYGNLFPALHLRYRISEATNLRAAVTSTIARPNFLDQAPNEYIRFDDEIIRRGNPDLLPARSLNLDLMAEHYFASVGMISAGVFYKDLSDFNFDFRERLTGGEFDGFELIQPRNAAQASVYGAEFAWHQRFDFLPGHLSGLGIFANYTYSSATTDFGEELDRDIRLPDQVPHVANVALSYDGFGFHGMVSANHQSDYIQQVGSTPADDRIGYQRTQIDASASQRLTPNLRLILNLNNLTNAPFMRYYGSTFFPDEDEYEGRWGSLGLRFNF
jgi:TonB-dependent receptor